MGKKTSNAKPATPAKRLARKKPAVESAPVPPPALPKRKSAPPNKTKPTATRAKKRKYSQDDVALRAYFIAERRQTAGLPGDAHQDWIEAERQLALEAAAVEKRKPRKR